MKSQILLMTAMGASGVLSQADHGAMSLDSSSQPTVAGNSSVPVTRKWPEIGETYCRLTV